MQQGLNALVLQLECGACVVHVDAAS
jgi:hypothetical protein